MNPELSITVADLAGPHLQKVIAGLANTRPLMQRVGGDLARVVRRHFAARDQEPNAKGWPKRHFWAQEGRRNTALASYSDNEAVVTIASAAIAHKLYGGTVRPKRGRALAIPASAEAYRAGQPSTMDRDMLDFVPLRRGGLVGMLIERQHDTLRRTKKGLRQGEKRGGKVWFWLMAQTTHAADPRALPDRQALDAAALSAAQNYVNNILEKSRP